jgi:SAM-dependent methyltransferase
MIDKRIKSLVRRALEWAHETFLPWRETPDRLLSWKARSELRFWRSWEMANSHYQRFYTEMFGLSLEDYRGKLILDIGCGPMGSLEWADMAAERVGLDPLARKYLAMGANRHKMRYVAAPSENIPFKNAYFDIVASFNSLDHVDDLNKTISEIIRVTKPNGLFLLFSDVGHEPTACEPLVFQWDVVDRFKPAFELVGQKHYERNAIGVYQSLLEGVPFDHNNPNKRCGLLWAKFKRKT